MATKAKSKEKQADTGEFGIDVENAEGLEIDLSDVDEPTFELIGRGRYSAEITDVEYSTSSNGNPMWACRMQITDGEHKGRTLYHHVVFSAKSMPFAKRFITRVAPELLEGPLKPEEVADEGILEGRACVIRVGVQRYEGEKRNNIREVLAAEGAEGGFLDT